MGWVTTAKRAAAARWFWPVVIGSIAVVVGAFGSGWLMGFDEAKTEYLVKMNEALEKQYKKLQKQKSEEIQLALRNEREAREIHARINQVPRPSGGCNLPPACLRWYDDVLQAARPD